MTEFYGPGDAIPHLPDDITIVQFLLDSHDPTRPANPVGLPWFIEEATGRSIDIDEVCPLFLTGITGTLTRAFEGPRKRAWCCQ